MVLKNHYHLIPTVTGFAISFLLLLLVRIVLRVNFEDIFDLSVLVFWSVYNASHLTT